MEPDKFQRAWQAHSTATRVQVDGGAMLEEVQRSQQSFRRMIRMRDYREIAIGLLMIPIWFIMGITMSLPWTWYLTLGAVIWGIGFFYVDRRRHKQKLSGPDDSLIDSAKESLVQVEHQIWLMRNLAWWYLLPYAIPITIFFGHTAWLTSGGDWKNALGFGVPLVLFVVVLYGFVYYFNLLAVRKRLEPRRQELIELIACLGDEGTGEVSGEYPILMGLRPEMSPLRILILAGVAFVFFLSIGVGGIVLGYWLDDDYPKLSPFSAVRWEESQPEVQVEDEWYALVALDGISASEIVAFSQETYGAIWQKRFEEDLVELLSRMGHPPEGSVTLVVQSLESSETLTIEDVPMTTANRRTIRNAAQQRAIPSSELSDESQSLAEVLERVRASHDLPAMAAFVMHAGEIVEVATVGTRSSKNDTPVGDDAQWHIGSNTKAMTATLAGVLVEEGLLEWDSTIGEILGEVAPDMDERHRDTTLTMLLSHRSGITPNISWYTAPVDRIECAAKILASGPAHERGEYVYSNAGYVVAGAMLEEVGGARWEDLLRAKILEPLGMDDTGFGAPTSPNSPWGHRDRLLGWSPMDPEKRGADNAPVLGPAGTVHTTLEDYARFVAAHLEGAQGKDGIVTAETFATLHRPVDGGDYALGWINVLRDWAGGSVLTHSGSNTMWYTTVWIAPERDMAFFAATNVGGDTAGTAVNDAIEALIGRHLELQGARGGYPKRAPYAAVRWEGDVPSVRIGEEWFTLVSIDDIPVKEITDYSREIFKPAWQEQIEERLADTMEKVGQEREKTIENARQTFDNAWRKRFEEDLVELMAWMGHAPKKNVRLVVIPEGGSAPLVLEDVAMTEENRELIRSAAR